ncbi:MAG TPA: hypothetical protein VMP01_27570 [Pirellulaceae bacterium]|nr:hypothetical protein [Pirellulaceae bacterium]
MMGWLVVASGAIADDAKVTVIAARDAEPPKEVRLETNIAQEEHYRLGRLLFRMSHVERELHASNYPLEASFSINHDIPWNTQFSWKSGRSECFIGIRFEQGNIFPLSGAVYRVEKLAQHDSQAGERGEGVAILKRLDDQWTKSICPNSDSLVVVLKQGTASLHHVGVDVTDMTTNETDADQPAIATVRFSIGKPPQLAPTARVRAGDILVLPTWKGQPKVYKHKVRRVVPPDKAKGVIGWIELDPEPIIDDPKP